MSKAATLLQKIKKSESRPTKASKRLFVDANKMVDVPSFDRGVRLAVAARYFRIVSKKMKSLQSELDVIKGVVRRAGEEALDRHMSEGVYYPGADCGGIKVTRANKFVSVDVDRDALLEAVGESYGAMFKEDAYIRFESVDALRRHLGMCDEMGLQPGGEVVVSVRGRPGLRERMCDMWDGLDEDRRELLTACAKDQAARVGVQ